MSTNRKKRLQSKMRKTEAFLRLAELNDQDEQIQESKRRRLGSRKRKQKNPCLSESADSASNTANRPPVELAKEKVPEKKSMPLLEGDEYEELRRRLRARKKAFQQFPHFMLKTVGNDAELGLPENMRTPLFTKDLQNLLLYSMLGTLAPVEPCRWCKFSQWNKLGNILLVIMDGVGLPDFERFQAEEKFRKVSSIFTHKLCFISPASYGSSVADDLCILPLSAGQKAKLRTQFGTVQAAVTLRWGDYFRIMRSVFPVAVRKPIDKAVESKLKKKHLAVDRSHPMPLKLRLLLTVSQLIQEGFPLPLRGENNRKRFENFVPTKDIYDEVTDASPIFAIDCEMCLTSTGQHELAKICVVDSDLKVVYTTLVVPDNTITNYLTKFSGITAKMLEGVTVKLKYVQDQLRKILPADAILVGHSLDSDLLAMKMFHPYVIDTSVIYCVTGIRGKKSKLKDLSRLFLGREIQQAVQGHDPEEDAKAAMELVLLKLQNGYHFGDMVLEGEVPQDDRVEEERVLATSMLKVAPEKTVFVTGSESSTGQYSDYLGDNVTFRKVEDNREAVREACKQTASSHLTICHLNVGEKVDQDPVQERTSLVMKSVRKLTRKLWKRAPQNGLFLSLWPGTENTDAFVGITVNKDVTQIIQ